jgi:putative transcriptional regulator
MSTLGDDLIEAMSEAVAYMGGNPGNTVTHEVRVPDAVDVAAIRKRTGLSRKKFADRFGLDVRAIQDWEQGRRRPELAARAYLKVIEHNPQAVEEALHAA